MFMYSYPVKNVPTALDIIEPIKKRWSPLAFSSEPIEREKIDRLFEAMRWAPSSFNEQPWRVIYATKDKPEMFEQLSGLLVEGNSWAKEAYMLLVICAIPNFAHNNKPNINHAYDTGAAMENLFLQAVSMNLVAHEMAGFNHDIAHDILRMPEDVAVLAMMAIGYPGDENLLSADLAERQKNERVRKPVSEVVFEGVWKV